MLLVAEGEALFLRLRGALSLFLGSAAVLALEPGWSWSLFLLLGTLSVFVCGEWLCLCFKDGGSALVFEGLSL